MTTTGLALRNKHMKFFKYFINKFRYESPVLLIKKTFAILLSQQNFASLFSKKMFIECPARI